MTKIDRMTEWDIIFTNATLATMAELGTPYGLIRPAAVGILKNKITYAGPMKGLARDPAKLATTVIDLEGRLITPGLIDCHTHLVFGGNRAGEFEMRLNGASYEEIALAGGGILSTVSATRAASEAELIESAEARLISLMEEGVTTIEIKSGYGLDLENERKMLKVARALGDRNPVRVKTTFLGAHAVPPEFNGYPDKYINYLIADVMPELAKEGLIDAVDAFCESIGFNIQETRKILSKAKEMGLDVKLHAEQLSDMAGTQLIAELGGLSADHIEYASEKSIKAMAKNGTVAVLLPGAFYTLRETKVPPIEQLRENGVPIAIATDANPGSSPALSLILMMNMGATLFRLTPEETLKGVTINAAKALGCANDRGSVEIGKFADLAVWNMENPAELSYWLGDNRLAFSIHDGQLQMLANPYFDGVFKT